MPRIMVTGGAGYLGSILVPQLVAEGYSVTVVDQFYFGRHALPAVPEIQCLAQDTRTLTPAHIDGHDAIIDLAAMSNDPCGETFSKLTREINHHTRYRTAQIAKETGVSRYILPSSCSVYGFLRHSASEDSPTSPLTVYAQANLDAEKDILALSSESFCVTILRLATLFGPSPRMRLDLALNTMTYNAWRHKQIIVAGDGTQKRPLLHVADAAEGIGHVMRADQALINGEIFNLGHTEQNLCINELAAQVHTACLKRRLPAPTIIRNGPADLRSYHVDFRKLERIFSWHSPRNVLSSAMTMIEEFRHGNIVASSECFTLDWYQALLA